MRNIFVACYGLLRGPIAGALCIFVVGSTGISQPRVATDSSVVHFGTVYNGEEVVRMLRLYNRGNAPLKIDAITSQCGCSRASVKSQNVSPDDSTEMQINFNGKSFSGSIRRHLIVISNDPGQRNMVLQIEADVKPMLRCTPSTVIIRGAEGPETTRVAIANLCPSTLRITGVTDPSGHVKPYLLSSDTLRAGESAKIGIVALGLPEQTAAGSIRVVVAGGPTSEIRIPYIVRKDVQE